MRRAVSAVVLVVLACRIERAPSGRPTGPATAADTLAQVEQDSVAGAQVEAVVRRYYARLAARDWRAVRENFWPGATITTRAAPGDGIGPRVAVLSVDEFLRQAMNGRDRLPASVFLEHRHVNAYEEIADAWVIWRALAVRPRAGPQRGLDAFHLVERGGQWRIVSVLTARETPQHPLLAPQR